MDLHVALASLKGLELKPPKVDIDVLDSIRSTAADIRSLLDDLNTVSAARARIHTQRLLLQDKLGRYTAVEPDSTQKAPGDPSAFAKELEELLSGDFTLEEKAVRCWKMFREFKPYSDWLWSIYEPPNNECFGIAEETWRTFVFREVTILEKADVHHFCASPFVKLITEMPLKWLESDLLACESPNVAKVWALGGQFTHRMLTEANTSVISERAAELSMQLLKLLSLPQVRDTHLTEVQKHFREWATSGYGDLRSKVLEAVDEHLQSKMGGFCQELSNAHVYMRVQLSRRNSATKGPTECLKELASLITQARNLTVDIDEDVTDWRDDLWHKLAQKLQQTMLRGMQDMQIHIQGLKKLSGGANINNAKTALEQLQIDAEQMERLFISAGDGKALFVMSDLRERVTRQARITP